MGTDTRWAPLGRACREQATSQLVPAPNVGQSERRHFREWASGLPRRMGASSRGLRGLEGRESSSHGGVEQERKHRPHDAQGKDVLATSAIRKALTHSPVLQRQHL